MRPLTRARPPVPLPPAGPSPHRDPWQDGKRNATGGLTRDEPPSPSKARASRSAARAAASGRRRRASPPISAPTSWSRTSRRPTRSAESVRERGRRSQAAAPRRDRPARRWRRGPPRAARVNALIDCAGHLPPSTTGPRTDGTRSRSGCSTSICTALSISCVRSWGSMAERGGGRIALIGSIAGAGRRPRRGAPTTS